MTLSATAPGAWGEAASPLRLPAQTVLFAGADLQAYSILGAALANNGGDGLRHAESAERAKGLVGAGVFDLIVVDDELPDLPGCQFIHWLRRSDTGANRFTPAILLARDPTAPVVLSARDAGANLLLRKPLHPQLVRERLRWVSEDPRPFVVSPTYCGPDRRRRMTGPPEGLQDRRETLRPARLSLSRSHCLNQAQIDALMTRPASAA